MTRHTFLDSILNRPSQSYTPGQGPESHAQQQRARNWSSPPDLPNAPSQAGSILGGSLFKRKSRANLSNLGSEAGASTSTLRSRFGRKRRDGGSQYAGSVADSSTQFHPSPSSVADSQATASRQRKGRWWENGAFSIGRRSRAPSIAGDSIFSEPEPQPGQVPWTAHGLAGIGAGSSATVPRRATRSDYGGSPSRSRPHQNAPPVPQIPQNMSVSGIGGSQRGGGSAAGSSGKAYGRLQSDVAPLGASTLNPSLNRKPSKSKLPHSSSSLSSQTQTLRKATSASHMQTRALSPAPSLSGSIAARVPGALASSPHQRRLSQDGRPIRGGGGDGSDWKDFVNSMSGSDISKAWQGMPNAPDMTQAAARGHSSSNLDRRKSHLSRLAKELEKEAQFEQTLRDPGVVHQDLLARAASQVVGSPPYDVEGTDYIGDLQPGSVIVRPSHDVRRSFEHSSDVHHESTNAYQQDTGRNMLTQQNMQSHTAAARQQHEDAQRQRQKVNEAVADTTANTTRTAEEDDEEDDEGEDEDDDEEEEEESSSDEDSVVPKQTMLEVVREEDEDGSSVGAEGMSRRQTLADLTEAQQAEAEEPKFKAFALALNKSRFNSSNGGHGGPSVPFNASASRNASVRSGSMAESSKASRPSSADGSQDSAPPLSRSGSQTNGAKMTTKPPRLQINNESGYESVTTPDEKQTHSFHSDSGTYSDDGRNDVFQDARSSSTEHIATIPSFDNAPPVPSMPPQLHLTSSSESKRLEAVQTKEKDEAEETLKDESDRGSTRSAQTGRNTVKFEPDTKLALPDDDDAKSTKSTAASRISRPPTLQRRLSDLSLGTSFGMSNIMRIGQSRTSSSRRIKLNDDDEDSAGSRSDGDDDEELRAKIQTEQDRLRNMKVGDDFFGGALSDILNKFDKTNWDEGLSSVVGQLGLDVGTQPAKRDSITAQEVLALNAQERVNEVRRMRNDTTPSKRRQELSETRTVESGIAPSFAALWLLNQAGEPSASSSSAALPSSSTGGKGILDSPASETREIMSDSHHSRKASNTSSLDDSLTRGASRLRNLFAPKEPDAAIKHSSPEKPVATTSVLDRPRQRGPRPKEMGGVSIAQGRLAPDAKAEAPEDLRSTLADVWTSQTLSQMKESQQEVEKSSTAAPSTSAGSEPALSPPGSPISKVVSSKDKPAPLKSAIKGGSKLRHSKSLADTLFSFPNDKSSKSKSSSKEDKAAAKVEKVAAKAAAKGKDKQKKSGAERSKAESTSELPRASLQSNASSGNASTLREASDRAADMQAPSAPAQAASQDLAVHAPTPVRASGPIADENDSEEDESMAGEQRGSWRGNGNDALHADTHDQDSVRSPPPVSELWSGESSVSTGPATPGASEVLGMGILPRRGFSPAHLGDPKMVPSPRDKMLPLPPVPSFEDEAVRTLHIHQDDLTPLAVTHTEPGYMDQMKTPRAESEEPAFGVNLIPPTPPAVDTNHQLSKASKQAVRPPQTLAEEDEDHDDGGAVEQDRDGSLQRSSSTRSKSTIKSNGSVSRKSSTKRRSSSTNPTGLADFASQGLSLPPGLVATTVASSASRRNADEEYEVSPDPTVKSRKSVKGKKSRRPKADEEEINGVRAPFVPVAPPSALAAPSMQHSLSENLASLAPPGARRQSDTSSGSDSMQLSVSPSPSPAVSVSGRSSAVSSSAASDTSSRGTGSMKHTAHAPPRKIRTTSVGPNGHVRTSLMSSISEWESSPMDQERLARESSPHSASPSGYASPQYPSHDNGGDASPSGYATPAMYQAPSNVTRSQSSVFSGPSPSVVRNAPIGAPTDAMLDPHSGGGMPVMPGANRRLSVPVAMSADGHSIGGRAPWGGSFLGDESQYSLGMQSQHSLASLPNVPQSSYRARDPVKASNAIDDRLYAKTTMSTIAVTSGAFRSKGSVRARRASIEADSTGSGLSRRASMEVARDGALVDELQKTTMSITSHTPPPRKLSSTQILVQVIACSIDDMDRLLLREKVRSENAYGFVPGRSFCGRVMETGWEVKRMRMGDVVFGLQSSRKCGALAEFMTIEQDLTAKAPQDCLTMEQIAALPSVGVLAHQLMVNHCSQLKRGSRILILNAHDGVGLLTMQECATLGLIIVAHCPNHISDGVAICEANGAHEVIIGEPLWALNSLHEASFDMVVDTVGGRRVYDAARRILAFEGQFCTCFGDMNSASANPNLRSHLRSLRRSFFKKDTKHLGYEWVGTDTAEDCREALEAVRRAAEGGLICPRLKSVLAFGEAPRAFENTLRGVEEEPGAVVVRIS